jgi:hypothetical protein
MNGATETRVRMGAKQTSKGSIQLDITTEASTVDEAGRLMGEAIIRLRNELQTRGLELVSDLSNGAKEE